MITRKNVLSILIATSFTISFGSIAYADVTIDGQVYTDAWLSDPANASAIANYLTNPATSANAAAIAAAAPASTQAAIYNIYRQTPAGAGKSFEEALNIANQTVAAKTATVVVLGGQAYTNEWLAAHPAEVAAYIAANPNYSATLLKNASASTVEAVRTAYNKANPNNQLSASAAQALINQNVFFSPAWLAANPGYKGAFDYQSLVNEGQLKIWLSQNPNVTPAQIVDLMMKYKINITELSLATGKGAQDLIKIAENSGVSREQLAKSGVIGALGFADTRNNAWWAVQAGVMNKGVVCAMFFIDQGKVNPECSQYSQADMNLALSYQKNGYWGPTGSGDPYTELTKAGLIKNGAYIGLNRWGTGNTGTSTGPNIAGTNYATTYTSVANFGKLPTYTPSANAISCAEYNISSNFACRGDLTVGTRVGDTKTSTVAEIKAFFAGSPTVSDIVEKAVSLKFTTYDVAKALAIAGVVNSYDLKAVTDYVVALPGYALGPDNIIVKLQPGQTKRASDGLLEGSWSSDAGHVSYTDWARAWYCTGAGDVNGGRVVSNASGALLVQDCSRSVPLTTTSAPAGSFATVGVVGTLYTNNTQTTAPIDTSSESCLNIPMTLSYQSRDVSTNGFVTKLQDFLHTTNYLTTASTGFFGAGTLKAVKAFQGANGISKTGSAGPNTRAKILQISCAMPVQDIAESDATIPDTGSTTSLPTGCTSAIGFSPITGIKCSITALPEGCTSNTTFSPVTGARCVAQ